MDARFERYIENLRTVRTLSQPKFSPDMKAKELLETIQSNAIKCFDYRRRTTLSSMSWYSSVRLRS